jgi:hypothetical protein
MQRMDFVTVLYGGYQGKVLGDLVKVCNRLLEVGCTVVSILFLPPEPDDEDSGCVAVYYLCDRTEWADEVQDYIWLETDTLEQPANTK